MKSPEPEPVSEDPDAGSARSGGEGLHPSSGGAAGLHSPAAGWKTALAPRLVPLIGIGVWASLIVKGVRKLFKGDGNDFTILHSAGVRLLEGEPIYDGTYMYPAFFLFVLAPLALLPMGVAGILWLVGKIPVFHASVSLFARLAGVPPEWGARLAWLSPVLVYRFLDSDCATGNVNVYLLGGLALGAAALSRARDPFGGAILAAVAAVKLAPAYILVALGVGGRWRAALIGAAVLVVLLLLPAWLTRDRDEGMFGGFFRTSASVFEATDAGEAGTGYVPGQSLRAIVHRLGRESDATAHDDGKVISIHWFDFEAATLDTVYRLLAASLALFGLAGAYRRGFAVGWVIAWSAIILLLISPYSRKAHFILLLPAYLHVLAAARTSRFALGSLGLSWALAELTTRAIWGKATAALITAHCSVGWAAVALLPALWVGKPLAGESSAAIVTASSPTGGSTCSD
ncbi:MAG: glycosyltransferase 87 family protein [Planctomycetota bacterium]